MTEPVASNPSSNETVDKHITMMTQGVTILTAGSVVGAVVSTVTVFAISYVLLPESLGIAAVVFAFAGLFVHWSDYGISTAVVSLSRNEQDFVGLNTALVKSYALIKILLGSILTTLALLVAIVTFASHDYLGVLVVGCFIVIGNAVATMSNAISYSHAKFKGIFLNGLTRKAVVLVSLILLGPVYQEYGYIGGTALAGLSGGAVAIIYLKRSVGKGFLNENLSIPKIRSDLSKMIKFGLPLFVSGILKYGYMTMPIVFLLLFRTTTDIGLFGFAQTLTGLTLLATVGFANTLLPVLSSIKEPSRIRSLVRQSNRLVLALSIPAAMFLAFEGQLVLSLFFSINYLNSAPILIGFAIQTAVYPVLHNLNATIAASGKTKVDTMKSGVMLVCSAVFCILLVPEYGGIGAAFALSLTFVFGILAGSSGINRDVPVFTSSFNTALRISLASILFIAVFHSLRFIIDSIPVFGVVFLIALAVYVLSCGVFGAVRQSDIHLIRSSLGNKGIFKSILLPLLGLYERILREPDDGSQHRKILIKPELVHGLISSVETHGTAQGLLTILQSNRIWHIIEARKRTEIHSLRSEWWYADETTALQIMRDRLTKDTPVIVLLNSFGRFGSIKLYSLKLVSYQNFKYRIGGWSGNSRRAVLASRLDRATESVYICSVIVPTKKLLAYVPAAVFRLIYSICGALQDILLALKSYRIHEVSVDPKKIQYTCDKEIDFRTVDSSSGYERRVLEVAAHYDGLKLAAGRATYQPLTGTWWIHNVFVNPEYRRQGIGRRIVESILECLREENAEEVHISASTRHITAQKIYRSAGFRRTCKCGQIERLLATKALLSPIETNDKRIVMQFNFQ